MSVVPNIIQNCIYEDIILVSTSSNPIVGLAVRKDSAKGLTTEWERFDFDAAAPLDEDARQDMYGGTSAYVSMCQTSI